MPAEVSNIAIERVDRFDMFCQTLSDEERAEMADLVRHVCDVMRRRHKHFGARMAKELIVALVDFEAEHPLKQ